VSPLHCSDCGYIALTPEEARDHEDACQPRVDHFRRILDEHARLFNEAALHSQIIARAIDTVRAERLNQQDGYLIAAIALLQQNEQLMKNAQALLMTAPPPILTIQQPLSFGSRLRYIWRLLRNAPIKVPHA
jgi:hypothetical protein